MANDSSLQIENKQPRNDRVKPKKLCVLLKITKHACVDKLDKVVKLEVENMVRVVGRQGRSLRER